MKNIGIVLFVIITAVLSIANKGGRASDKNTGSTGAPGEPQACKNCHNGNIVVNLKMYLLDGVDTVSQYEPGKKYTIDVQVLHTSGPVPKGYGFQITGHKAKLGNSGETILNLSPNTPNVKTATTSSNRFYAEHKGTSSTPLFKIDWEAPAKGTGPVSFYTAGNGVNNNNDDSGDGASKTSMQIDEKINTSVEGGLKNEILNVFPNPARTHVQISKDLVSVYSNYQLISSEGKVFYQGELKEILNLDQCNSGVIFLNLFNKANSSHQLIKLIKID
ncbi:MAG: hypothetical protein HOP11_03200 [Saprospiraceae bacterium]|nr:hypothetical protein [Saprospiraceae bacterium]